MRRDIGALGIAAGVGMTLLLAGCGTTPVHGVLISAEKNIWVEEPSGGGLSYCLSNPEGSRAEPVCYAARRGFIPEKSEPAPRVEKSSSRETPSSPQKEPLKAENPKQD